MKNFAIFKPLVVRRVEPFLTEIRRTDSVFLGALHCLQFFLLRLHALYLSIRVHVPVQETPLGQAITIDQSLLFICFDSYSSRSSDIVHLHVVTPFAPWKFPMDNARIQILHVTDLTQD